jgi:hypothetical protein
MPSSAEILAGLQTIANGWPGIAVGWHVALGALLVSLFVGWRPGKQLAGVLLAAPLGSVSVLAWLAGNPFNGMVFGAMTLALIWVALKLPGTAVNVGAPWAVLAGGVLTAFGWIYPHFLVDASWTSYGYATPLGLIPCPSLSAVVGIALVLDGLGSRAWPLIVAAGGLMYGLIGAFRLGVVIDVVLLAGALILVVASARPRSGEYPGGATSGRTSG